MTRRHDLNTQPTRKHHLLLPTGSETTRDTEPTRPPALIAAGPERIGHAPEGWGTLSSIVPETLFPQLGGEYCSSAQLHRFWLYGIRLPPWPSG